MFEWKRAGSNSEKDKNEIAIHDIFVRIISHKIEKKKTKWKEYILKKGTTSNITFAHGKLFFFLHQSDQRLCYMSSMDFTRSLGILCTKNPSVFLRLYIFSRLVSSLSLALACSPGEPILISAGGMGGIIIIDVAGCLLVELLSLCRFN